MVKFNESKNEIIYYYVDNKKDLVKPSYPYKHTKYPKNLQEMREFKKINMNLKKKYKKKYNNRIKKYFNRLKKKSQYINYDFLNDINLYLFKIKKIINLRRELEWNIKSINNIKLDH